MPRLWERMVQFCTVSRLDPDTGKKPKQQISYLGKNTQSTAWYPYGFHARAPVDCLSVMLQPNASDRVHLPGSPAFRPKDLADTEVSMYYPLEENGQPIDPTTVITFKTNGDIDIKTAANVTVNAAQINAVATESVSVCAPAIYVGDGTEDIVDLMSDMATVMKGLVITGSNFVTSAYQSASIDPLIVRIDSIQGTKAP